jgi:NADH-ubiquinone oxidoreductase chain 5
MYLALIVLPILGSIMSGFFGRKIGVNGAQLITCSCVITTTILAINAFLEVGFNNVPVTIHLFRWIDVESLNVSWAFNFDSLTVSMLIPVLIVSSLVHVYSIGYMSHDPHNQRFFSYLSLFTFMMIILVTADNFLLMFVGWEGVGVCSYLLVSFWFTRIAANQSSLSAFLTNRVGDCFLTIGMFAILWSMGDINYFLVFSLSPFFNENVIIIIGICLLIGAMAKSSQVGLHVWLPMAMEGPTPVSALIHAATMVTAGVYLLMRTSPIIEYSSIILLIILWIGAITTVFSSLIGLFQQDIKKVIAYSTMSQLGMMVIAVGLSSYNLALFHLVNHAFYKALLFLGAGAVIHAVNDNQDFRKYGGLINYLPLSYSIMLIASLSLVAFPFMTGFYSKDLIIESAFGQYNLSSIII